MRARTHTLTESDRTTQACSNYTISGFIISTLHEILLVGMKNAHTILVRHHEGKIIFGDPETENKIILKGPYRKSEVNSTW
jgi:hypothetical protein